MYDFNGRSRKPQMTLADELGLTEYPAPAGGCLLTDPNYSYKLKDLLEHNKDPEYKDINFLRVGRQFRYSDECKIFIGRHKEENEAIKALADPDDIMMRVEGCGSPTVILLGNDTDEAIGLAASMCARYSDAKKEPEVKVTVTKGDETYYLMVKPADYTVLDEYRIEKKKKKKQEIA
jgi:hypothetical protein